jgi:two-component system sensor histidine kinase DesK
MARGVVAVVSGALCVVGFLHVLLLSLSPLAIAAALACMAALSLLQVLYFGNPDARLATRTGYLALAVQACLVYLPITVYRAAWVGMPGFLAGSALLVLPAAAAWPAVGFIIGSMGVTQALLGGTSVDVAYTMVSTILTGLVIYGLSRLASLVGELHAAQAELSHMAVIQERLRIARDLHDVLGYGLSAIALKTELAQRLLPAQPERAAQELAETLRITREALDDIRDVSAGYRTLSLEEELRSVRSVLRLADIAADFDVDPCGLPEQVASTLALVLREAVTNIIRHSRAQHAVIRLRRQNDEVCLRVLNDGVPQVAPARAVRARPGGQGLPNLAARVGGLGGRFSAAPGERLGTFELHVVIPLLPPIAPPREHRGDSVTTTRPR